MVPQRDLGKQPTGSQVFSPYDSRSWIAMTGLMVAGGGLFQISSQPENWNPRFRDHSAQTANSSSANHISANASSANDSYEGSNSESSSLQANSNPQSSGTAPASGSTAGSASSSASGNGGLRPPYSSDAILASAEQDRKLTQQILGHWKLDDAIQREIIMRPDGTATMQVKLDYLSSLIYGKELNLELNWKIENGILDHLITGGTPDKNVKSIIRSFGAQASYRVVKLEGTELQLEGPLTSRKIENWKALPTTPNLTPNRIPGTN